jgi:hypothetical protein
VHLVHTYQWRHEHELPEQMESRLERSNQVGNEEIYAYATSMK